MISQTTILITVLLGILTLVLPRKHFLLPYIIAACFIPTDQRLIIMGADFTVLRILVVVGIARLFFRNEIRSIRKNNFDILLFSWAICGAFIYIVQWGTQAIVYKCGVLFDILGLYWIFRQAIRSWKDISYIAKTFAVFAVISVVLVLYERITQRNPFAHFGNVFTGFHRGRYRCRGAFPHSLMLGIFWTSLIPIFYAFVISEQKKIFWIFAIIASVSIMVLSGSSTPILTLVATITFLSIYKYRRYGRRFFWAFCGLLVFLHFVREQPVWHLLARVNVFGGSTGWHRYHLMDKTIKNFGEWFLLGTKGTEHWGYGLGDVTNQYILEGVRGGFITMVLFIALLTLAIKITVRFSLKSIPDKYKTLSWGICVVLLGHSVSFFSVSYFGQIMMLLYIAFAIVGFIYDESERHQIHQIQLRRRQIHSKQTN